MSMSLNYKKGNNAFNLFFAVGQIRDTAALHILTREHQVDQAPNSTDQVAVETPSFIDDFTLWLCQNSYWKWPFIVDLPIENDFPT